LLPVDLGRAKQAVLTIRHRPLGAELTGGGMGGNMIALTPGVKMQEKIASVLEREGYSLLRVTIVSNKLL
jgi:mevalonate kinase